MIQKRWKSLGYEEHFLYSRMFKQPLCGILVKRLVVTVVKQVNILFKFNALYLSYINYQQYTGVHVWMHDNIMHARICMLITVINACDTCGLCV